MNPKDPLLEFGNKRFLYAEKETGLHPWLVEEVENVFWRPADEHTESTIFDLN